MIGERGKADPGLSIEMQLSVLPDIYQAGF